MDLFLHWPHWLWLNVCSAWIYSLKTRVLDQHPWVMSFSPVWTCYDLNFKSADALNFKASASLPVLSLCLSADVPFPDVHLVRPPAWQSPRPPPPPASPISTLLNLPILDFDWMSIFEYICRYVFACTWVCVSVCVILSLLSPSSLPLPSQLSARWFLLVSLVPLQVSSC